MEKPGSSRITTTIGSCLLPIDRLRLGWLRTHPEARPPFTRRPAMSPLVPLRCSRLPFKWTCEAAVGVCPWFHVEREGKTPVWRGTRPSASRVAHQAEGAPSDPDARLAIVASGFMHAIAARGSNVSQALGRRIAGDCLPSSRLTISSVRRHGIRSVISASGNPLGTIGSSSSSAPAGRKARPCRTRQSAPQPSPRAQAGHRLLVLPPSWFWPGQMIG